MSDESENKIRGSTDPEEEMRRIFPKNLKFFLRQRGMNYTQLANELGTSRQAVHKWITGESLPRSGMLQRISNVLLCDMADLIKENAVEVEGEPEESIPQQLERFIGVSQNIPVYDPLSCGKGAFVDGGIEDYIRLPQSWVNPNCEYFVNKAQGDSMEPGIKDGEYLVFQRADVVPIGRIGAFSLNGQYYCKRLKKFNDGSLWLYSDNEDYRPIEIKPDDDFRFLGVYSFKILKVTQ